MKTKEKFIRHDLDWRGFLECMAWAGMGMLWASAGGAFASGILRPAKAVAAEAKSSVAADFTFVQISDSHIGQTSPPRPARHAMTKSSAYRDIRACPTHR